MKIRTDRERWRYIELPDEPPRVDPKRLGKLVAALFVVGAFFFSFTAFADGVDSFSVVIGETPGRVGTADCARQRITIDRRVLQTVSENALADILAHELAHLDTNCNGHGPEWYQAYVRRGVRHE